MTDEELEEVRAKFSQGLSPEDASVIKEIVPGVVRTASQAEISSEAKYTDKSAKSMVIGITPDYAEMLNYKTARGKFITEDQYLKETESLCARSRSSCNTFQERRPDW